MVEKTNTNNSTPDAGKSSDKKSDDGNWQSRKGGHRKGNKYKKTTSQSTFIGGTEEPVTDMFIYGATMGKDYVNSKEAFITYVTMKYGTNAMESL